MKDQLRLGSSAQPGEAPGFVTDQAIVAELRGVQTALRGMTARLGAICGFLDSDAPAEPSPEGLRLLVERLAHDEHWPPDVRALARETLGLAA